MTLVEIYRNEPDCHALLDNIYRKAIICLVTVYCGLPSTPMTKSLTIPGSIPYLLIVDVPCLLLHLGFWSGICRGQPWRASCIVGACIVFSSTRRWACPPARGSHLYSDRQGCLAMRQIRSRNGSKFCDPTRPGYGNRVIDLDPTRWPGRISQIRTDPAGDPIRCGS
jgi:hypothetical protein